MRAVYADDDVTYVDPTALRALRYILRGRLAEHPALFLPFARWRREGQRPEIIGPDTQMVIDGYPRSANTFAVYAFQIAQPDPVRLAHHMHAPAQLIEAARRRIPALVVIREPEEAVVSNAMFEEDASLAGALVSYERFYSRLLPFARAMVAGRFEDVTRGMGVAIDRLNKRFGTAYRSLEPSEDNLQRCFELMSFKERADNVPELRRLVLDFESGTVTADELLRGGSALLPAQADREVAWTPTAGRSRSKVLLQERLASPRLTPLRVRALEAYQSFLAATGD